MLIVNVMDLECTHLLTVTNTRVNLRTVIIMVKESGFLLTGQKEKEHSKTTRKMELAYKQIKMVLKKGRFGKMESSKAQRKLNDNEAFFFYFNNTFLTWLFFKMIISLE
jgi:hypothetical protein